MLFNPLVGGYDLEDIAGQLPLKTLKNNQLPLKTIKKYLNLFTLDSKVQTFLSSLQRYQCGCVGSYGHYGTDRLRSRVKQRHVLTEARLFGGTNLAGDN